MTSPKPKPATKPKPAKVTIHPVPGHFLQGVPTIVQLISKTRAAFLVAHGAFSYTPPPETPVETQPTGPADAGPSDSEA